MPSTYSTNLAIELIGNNDQAGTWGNTTNTNLGTLIEQAISGYVTQAVSTGTDTTITIPNGATGVARNMYIELTGTGGASTNLIVPANKKLYFIYNNTSSGQVTVKVAGQTGVSVPNGKKMVLVSNGTDIVTAENYVASLSTDNLSLTGNLTLSGGTANGVLYLNGSKVATSGTALVFDGSKLGINRTPSAGYALDVDTSNGSYQRITGSDQGNVRLRFDNGGTGGRIWELVGGLAGANNADFSIRDVTGGTSPLVITSTTLYTASGINVGIGTSSPGYKLDVVGAINASAASPTGFNHALRTTGVTTGRSQIYLNNTSGDLVLGIEGSTAGASYAGTAAYSAFAATTGANPFYVITNSTIRATFDSSGNLGLGVTPSAWASTWKAFDLNSAGSISAPTTAVLVSYNAYYDGTNYIRKGANYSTDYVQTAGEHWWRIAASAGAGTTISYTQAMTLDASGNLVVGGTTANARFTALGASASSIVTVATLQNPVNAAGTGHGAQLILHSTTDTGRGVAIASSSSSNFAVDNAMLFYTSTSSTLTERARITSGGYFKASNTGGYDNATGTYHEFLNNDASDNVLLITHFGATNPNGVGIAFTAASPDDNTQYFLRCADSTTARCFIYSDGDLANHDGVYGTISDERLKQDIVDAPSQWDDLKAVRFRKYRMKTDVEANPNAPALLGVVAQELEQTSPGLIDEHPNEDGTTTKTVKSSILLMKAAVALQEAMTRIEKLEAEVSALKGD